jgi:hypothetical protein
MQQVRPTPFDLVFEPLAQTTFPAIAVALTESGQSPTDRDPFLMQREVVTLLRDLRPDEGLGEGIDQLAALVHHAYLFWDAGKIAVELPLEPLDRMLGELPDPNEEALTRPAHYTQLPEHRIWAQVAVGQAYEPLDGYFQYAPEPGFLRVLGVFGMQPERPGFSVVEVGGPRPTALARPDGSALFASTLAGGSAAGLYSLAGGEELLELAWRTWGITTIAGATKWRA